MDETNNAKLLREIDKAQGAVDYGSVWGFFETMAHWRCPCCFRNKAQTARLDRNGNLLCAFHRHHDHFTDSIPDAYEDQGFRIALVEGFSRFQPTLICNDCNVAEPTAKRIVDAPIYFSFTPAEIAAFIVVRPNKPHDIDTDKAREIYDRATKHMAVISPKLRSLVRGDDSTFEHIGRPALRVVALARKHMDERDQ